VRILLSRTPHRERESPPWNRPSGSIPSWTDFVLLDEAVDRGLEIDDRVEHAVFQPSAGELGEEALDSVEPCAGCRDEVEGPARMPGQPRSPLGCL